MRAGLRLAFGTLTAIRTAPPPAIDRDCARRAMLLAPVTALPVAAIWSIGAALVAVTSMPPALLAAVLVAVTALYSRGLHLDGLADTADGLSSGYDRERALAVMKTGDVGPSGAVAIVLTLLVQTLALGALLRTPAGAALALVALVTSRHVLAVACWSRVPAARSTGLGATVAGSVPTRMLIMATCAALALSALLAHACGAPWYAGPLTVAAGLVATGSVLRVAIRRVGGMSGDVLGACVEISLAGALLVATAALG